MGKVSVTKVEVQNVDELPFEIPKIHELLFGDPQISEIPDLSEECLVALWVLLKGRQSEMLPHAADPGCRPA